MDDIGPELLEVAAYSQGDGDRQAIFGAAGDGDGGNVDKIAGRRKSWLGHGRRIHSNLDALAQQKFDEAVQRLVGAVPYIIVIARKQGHAKVASLHAGGL